MLEMVSKLSPPPNVKSPDEFRTSTPSPSVFLMSSKSNVMSPPVTPSSVIPVVVLLASGIVIVYTATGGYLAVTYTDWVQFVLLLLGVVVILRLGGLALFGLYRGMARYASVTELVAITKADGGEVGS